MNIFFKHIIRNVRSNKFRSFLIIISLALSTLILYSNLSISDGITEKYVSILHETYKTYDLKITKDQKTDTAKFKMDKLNLSSIDYENLLTMNTFAGRYSDKSITVIFEETDLEKLISDELCTIIKQSDKWEKTDSGQVIISNAAAERYNLDLNDTIVIETAKGKLEFEIGAIAENKGLFSQEASSSIVLFGTKGAIDKENTEEFDLLYLDAKEAVDIDEVVQKFKDKNKDYDISKLVNYDQINNGINNTKRLLTIILVAIVGINFFVISSLMKLLLATRIPVVGTFQSVGASKKMVSAILLLENAVYGVIGGVAGVVIAIILNKNIIQIFTGYENVSAKVNLAYVLMAVLFSVVLQIIIVLSGVIKAGKNEIIKSIFNKVDVAVKIKAPKCIIGSILVVISIVLHQMNGKYDFIVAVSALITAIIGGSMMFAYVSKCIVNLVTNKMKHGPIRMGIKNVTYSKATSSNVSLVAISLAVILIVYSISMSLGNYFENTLSNTLTADYVITGMADSMDKYEFLKNNTTIDDIKELYVSTGETYIEDKKYPSVQMVGMSEPAMGVKDPDGLMPNLKENEVLLDEIFARKNGYAIGDTIKVSADYINEDSLLLKIKGFVDVGEFNTGRTSLIVNRDKYFKHVSKVPSMLLVSTNDNSTKAYDQLVKEVNENGLFLITSEDYIGDQEDSVNQVLYLLYCLIALSVILAVVGIVNNQLVGFLQRQREYAILMSVAMSKAQIKAMIISEVVVSFFISCLLGSSLGLWLGKLAEKLMFSLGICIYNNISISSILALVSVTFVLLSSTIIVPMLRLKRIDVVEQIKNEE